LETLEVNIQFEQVLRFVNQTDQFIFLTGKAGTGKTTLLKHIRKNTYKQMAVVAPTGVAAINAGGTTIHSFFQFPFTPFLPPLNALGQVDYAKGNLPVLKHNSQRLAIFRNLELLVIDEISMVRADLLDQIDFTLRQTRKKWHLPFGGVQLMLIGDMYQLPPVVPHEDWRVLKEHYPSPFFFDSFIVKANPPVYIELEKIYRQSEETFISLLNMVRNNALDDHNLHLLNSHYKAQISESDYRSNITLTTHNKKADEINLNALKALPGKEFRFKCKVEGLFSEKNYPADEDLILKQGTRVMFLKNNNEKNYYNGKIGIVTQIDKDKIKVKCDEDVNEIEVPRESWSNVSYNVQKETKQVSEEVLGTFSQFPLRLAWAITIHKSQGLTFDKLIIDAAEAFSSGQVYVALSRCRGLKGLTLSSKITPASLLSDKQVVGFSAGKHNHEEVNSIFSRGQKSFLKTVLLNLFDFSEAKNGRKDMAGILLLHKSRLNAEGLDWANSLFTSLDEVCEVAAKFLLQLGALADQALDPEQDAGLQERVRKASSYFEEACENILKMLKTVPLRTESKEAASEINEGLQILFDFIFQKKNLLAACKRGFQFQDFVKNKLSIKYPDYKVNIYATGKNTRVASEVKNKDLFRQLLLLRDELCEEEQKPIFMVARNKTLQELCEFLPSQKEHLLQISGFGKATIEKYGEPFLKVIREYMEEHNLQGEMDSKPPSKKSKKKPSDGEAEKPTKKGNSKEETFHLYKKGLKFEEIATQRGLSISTVQAHLAPFIENGELNIDYVLSREKQKLIATALENHKAEEGITPIKKALPENISYADIRYMIAFAKRQV
jgi:hypothetical protein